jgi:hypothetical protein
MATVFQAEVHAILMATADLGKMARTWKEVTIYVDSQAALKALAKPLVKSGLIKECVEALNTLGKQMTVTLRWVKAHVGTRGNEIADKLAKEGSAQPWMGPEPCLPVGRHEMAKIIKEKTNNIWQTRWNNNPQCQQSKMMLGKISWRESKLLIKLNREECGEMLRFLTGHNFLNRHQSLVDGTTSPLCRLCEEDEETSYHLTAECPVLQTQRKEVFGSEFLVFDKECSMERRLQDFSPMVSSSLQTAFGDMTSLIEWVRRISLHPAFNKEEEGTQGGGNYSSPSLNYPLDEDGPQCPDTGHTMSVIRRQRF